MGSGTDVAIEAADVTLMRSDLRGVVTAVRALAADHADHQGEPRWAFGYNLVLVPVAAGVLYPIWGMLLVADPGGAGHGLVFRVGGRQQPPAQAGSRRRPEKGSMIGSPFLEGRDRYERAMEGWVDNTHDDAFTHTVRSWTIVPGVESAPAAPPPRATRCGPRARARSRGRGPRPRRTSALAGARMVGGLHQAPDGGGRSGTGLRFLVDAGIEVARLASRRPSCRAKPRPRLALGRRSRLLGARHAGWIDLPGSCFTYSAAGARSSGPGR